MIAQIAETVSAFFYSMDVIEEEEKGKSRYGIEIIISTIIGFSVIIISGILLSKTNLAIAYLICIVPIRMYTGGYHAKTYFKWLNIDGINSVDEIYSIVGFDNKESLNNLINTFLKDNLICRIE